MVAADGIQRIGIIPAYAGSTNRTITPETAAADHSRVCGEHSLLVSGVIRTWGSSPRMRGAHLDKDDLELNARIIPAYAGSTWRWSHCRRSGQDHPRVSGEHCR